MSIFKLEARPAREGDCLLISYGADERSLNHVLIDAGRSATGRDLVKRLSDKGITELELLVVSHVDADHIEGVIDFLERLPEGFVIKDVWFNGWRHLQEDLEGFGPAQGERLTTLISKYPWNAAVDGAAIRTGDQGEPLVLPTLRGGMTMTVLSPDRAKLAKMVPAWEKACQAAGLVPGEGKAEEADKSGLEVLGGTLEALAAVRTKDDTAPANGTSIALLAEWEGRTVLLAADAHPDLLIKSLRKLGREKALSLDLFKLPHHGSQANVTQALIVSVECDAFLVSTDGSKFNHPDEVAIARVLVGRKTGTQLLFNYRQPRTTIWEGRALGERRYPFTCRFPDADGEPLIVDVLSS